MSNKKKDAKDKDAKHDEIITQIELAAQILNKYGLTDIDVQLEKGGFKISKHAPAPIQGGVHNIPASEVVHPALPATTVDPLASKPAVKERTGSIVTSPMVGTAYLSPNPTAKPFVTVGTHVKKDQILLIIEAMKTMNHVQSPRDGIVKEIIVKNAEPVEYGDALVELQ